MAFTQSSKEGKLSWHVGLSKISTLANFKTSLGVTALSAVNKGLKKKDIILSCLSCECDKIHFMLFFLVIDLIKSVLFSFLQLQDLQFNTTVTLILIFYSFKIISKGSRLFFIVCDFGDRLESYQWRFSRYRRPVFFDFMQFCMLAIPGGLVHLYGQSWILLWLPRTVFPKGIQMTQHKNVFEAHLTRKSPTHDPTSLVPKKDFAFLWKRNHVYVLVGHVHRFSQFDYYYVIWCSIS